MLFSAWSVWKYFRQSLIHKKNLDGLHLAVLAKIALIDEKSEIEVFVDNRKVIGN